ncbi:ornithine carbamoyltransferase 1 [Ephemerocybe angulata]|uniref:ornithine carbamoyltransferase n=1 Tax=Ephemerocybe angulata TaxID=980116 RepID=A0A8H6IDS6_9AGAR|nr:ornithine carbamoyltransferase 1 [Tulosesus angulatus]
MASKVHKAVPHLMTLADLTEPWLLPHGALAKKHASKLKLPSQSLFNKTIALLFSKRSTRTRLAAETSATLLGGRALFLGRDDIQLGRAFIGGMCQGIFARVGEHSEIEVSPRSPTYVNSRATRPFPVLNALSSLWHPTQILADLLTLHEHAYLFEENGSCGPLTVAYVGDAANVLHDMLVTYPRLGHKLRIASPPQYRAPAEVWRRVEELGCDKDIWWGEDPKEAVMGADVVVTDTWISMGQEAEKAERLKAFEGYQVTEELCRLGGANPNWKFMHCLPRKPHEVDDEVFYGPRSLVFPEADNRKWTIMALFDNLFGRWTH